MRPRSSGVIASGAPGEQTCGAGATGGLVGGDLNLSPVVRLIGTGSGFVAPAAPLAPGT